MHRFFRTRFPGVELPPDLIVADIEATLQGTNQFYEAFAAIQREKKQLTLELYGVIVARVFHPRVHARLEQVRSDEVVEVQRAWVRKERAGCAEFLVFVFGVGATAGGGVLIFKEILAAGIPLVVLGGLGLVAVVGSKVYAECRLGPGAEPRDLVAHVDQQRINVIRDEGDDIEAQLGDEFARRVAVRNSH